MKANSETVSWLTSVPASDQNFKDRLTTATLADCEEALKHVSGKGVVTAIERRMKSLFSEGKHQISPRPAARSSAEVTKPTAKDSAPGKLSNDAAARQPVTLATLDRLPALPAAPEDEWENARRYSQMAEGFSQATVVAQVMCGFELIELQRRTCATRGGDRSKPNDSVLPWPKLVKEKINRSDDTARNWMNMARAVQPKLRKLDGPWQAPTLLALPPSEWPEEARASVEKTLKGICEGQTQADFMRELGLAKRPQGSAVKGGHHPGSGTPVKDTPQQAAIDIWTPTIKALAYDGLHEKSWVDLPDHGDISRETLEGLLIDLGKLLRDARPAKKSGAK